MTQGPIPRHPASGRGHSWPGGGTFEAFWRAHFPRLVDALRGQGLDGEAEDVAQETLVRAYQRRDELDFSRPIWPWLRRVASNLASDRRKGRSRQLPVDPSELPATPVEPPDIEERFAVSEALRLMPERQARVMSLRYLEDLDPEEIGMQLGVSRAGVNQLLYRARSSFRAAYRRAGEAGWGVLALPLRWLKRVLHEAGERARRQNARFGQAEQALSPVVNQFVTGVVALFLTVGAQPEIPTDGRDSDPRPSGVEGVSLSEKGPDAPRDRGPGRSRPSREGASTGVAPSAKKADPRELVEEVTRPNRDVTQPEDARLTSLAPSPGYERDGTIFAAGITLCRRTQCPSVLFRSTDGGRRWERLGAEGFYGVQVLLPPDYGQGDDRVFAMGPTGLQVSENGGDTFTPAAVAGPTNVVGSAAISPGFNSGDPTILIGSQTLMRYRDDLRTIEAVPSTAIPGPLEPAFPPTYGEDGTLLVGGLRMDPAMGQAAATVYACADAICSSTPVSEDRESPRLRMTSAFAESGLVHAFTQWGVFASRDSGRSFEEVETPWSDEAPLADLAVGGAGRRLFAAVTGLGPDSHSDSGVYSSVDGGAVWNRIDAPLLASGASAVKVLGARVIVALRDGGVACSRDGGASWRPRC